MSDRIVLEGEVSLRNHIEGDCDLTKVIDGEGVPFFLKKAQEKTATPLETEVVVTPDTGYSLEKVTVEAIPDTYIGSAVPQIGAQTVTPTESTQTIATENKYLTGDITVNPIPPEYIVTSDADATAADIYNDKTAYVNGTKLTGTYQFNPLGENMEYVTGWSYTGDLKNDTTFDTWTASTTAGTIKATATAGTFTADMVNYEYLIQCEFGIKMAYTEGATLKTIPIEFVEVINHYIMRRANTIVNTRAGNYNYNVSQPVASAPYVAGVFYYNSSGTQTVAFNTGYGIYCTYPTHSLSSTANNSITVTVKTPPIAARCSTTYFATARKAEVDSENTEYFMRIKVYRCKKGTYMDTMYEHITRLINEVEGE